MVIFSPKFVEGCDKKIWEEKDERGQHQILVWTLQEGPWSCSRHQLITPSKAGRTTSKITLIVPSSTFCAEAIILETVCFDGFALQSDCTHKACTNDKFTFRRPLPALKIPRSLISCGTAPHLEQAPCIKLCKLYNAREGWTGTWECIDQKRPPSWETAAMWSGSFRNSLDWDVIFLKSSTLQKKWFKRAAYTNSGFHQASSQVFKVCISSYQPQAFICLNTVLITAFLPCILRGTHNLELLLLLSCSTKAMFSSTEQFPEFINAM